MNPILLCTSDPMLLKSVYGVLRQCGFWVDTTGQTAAAVQMALGKSYGTVILDAECVGLSASDAARILERESGGTSVIVVGECSLPAGAVALQRPPDLEELRHILQTMGNNADNERSVVSL